MSHPPPLSVSLPIGLTLLAWERAGVGALLTLPMLALLPASLLARCFCPGLLLPALWPLPAQEVSQAPREGKAGLAPGNSSAAMLIGP